MTLLDLVKWLHVLSATSLFGTGLGSAFYFLRANLSGEPAAIAFAARTVVVVDWLFVLPAVIVQPLSGALMIYWMGYDPGEAWLIASYVLYLVAGLCWIPAVWLQIRMRTLASAAMVVQESLPPLYRRYFRLWFLLGWPAFLSVVVILYLMIARPS